MKKSLQTLLTILILIQFTNSEVIEIAKAENFHPINNSNWELNDRDNKINNCKVKIDCENKKTIAQCILNIEGQQFSQYKNSVLPSHMHTNSCEPSPQGHYKNDPTIQEKLQENEFWIPMQFDHGFTTAMALSDFIIDISDERKPKSFVIHNPDNGDMSFCSNIEYIVEPNTDLCGLAGPTDTTETDVNVVTENSQIIHLTIILSTILISII